MRRFKWITAWRRIGFIEPDRLISKSPIFKQTAAYGHFGRTEPGFTWENTDKADELRKAAS